MLVPLTVSVWRFNTRLNPQKQKQFFYFLFFLVPLTDKIGPIVQVHPGQDLEFLHATLAPHVQRGVRQEGRVDAHQLTVHHRPPRVADLARLQKQKQSNKNIAFTLNSA